MSKNPTFFGVLAFVIMISTIFAGLGNNIVQAASIQFTEGQVTSNTAAQVYPDVYGDRIVWQDNRNGNWDIYLYAPRVNMWQPEIQITTSSGNDVYPKIYNDIIVYQSDRNGNWDIYTYNISSRVETQITNNSAPQSDPAIYGNKIVWQDARNSVFSPDYREFVGWDIYIYDLTTNTEQRVPLSVGSNYSPDISGDYIAVMKKNYSTGLSGMRFYKAYVYLYDLTTGQETYVTNGPLADAGVPSSLNSPTVSGTQVAWVRYSAGKDVATEVAGASSGWASGAGNQQNPDIGGDGQSKYLVYDDDRNGNYEIYLYEVESGIENRVTNNPSVQADPSIFSGRSADGWLYNRIVFTDNRNGNWDIYVISFGWVAVGVPGPNPYAPTPLTPSLVVSQLQMLKNDYADASYIPTSDFSGANDIVRENRRNAITNQLDSVIESIQDAVNAQNSQTRIKYCQNAIDQLTELLAKTDGYTLRETPDIAGSRYTPDWVSGFTAQLYLYQVSSYCLTELQTLLANAYGNA